MSQKLMSWLDSQSDATIYAMSYIVAFTWIIICLVCLVIVAESLV